MSQYQFISPTVQPSITQDIAGALQTGLNVYRQRKADAAAEQERQMGDVERGWRPAGSATTPSNSTIATPGPSAPDDSSGGSMSVPTSDEADAATPVGAAQVAPSASGGIASAIGSIRAQRASADPMAGNDESMASAGMSGGDDAAPVRGPAPMMNVATGDPKTSSGMPADTRTGDAPSASDVRVGNMTYDFRRSTTGQQMQFASQLQAEREARQNVQATNDRNRRTQDLVASGMDPTKAAAVADGSLKPDDVQVGAGDQARFANNLQLERERIAAQRDLETQREGAESRLEGQRQAGENRRSAITHQDTHDAALDRYADDAQQGYASAVSRLNTLQNNDPRQQSPDPAVVAAWTADVAAAQADVTQQHGRVKQYQGMVDQRTGALSGTPIQSTAPAGKKSMSPSQSDRAQRDPQYRAFLQDQGYDTTAPAGGFNYPFRVQ